MMNLFAKETKFSKCVRRSGKEVLFTVEPHSDGKSSYIFASIAIEGLGLAKITHIETGWPFAKGLPKFDYAARADTVIGVAETLVEYSNSEDVVATAELLSKLLSVDAIRIRNELVMVNALSAAIVVLPDTGYDLEGIRRSMNARKDKQAVPAVNAQTAQQNPPEPAKEPEPEKKKFH